MAGFRNNVRNLIKSMGTTKEKTLGRFLLLASLILASSLAMGFSGLLRASASTDSPTENNVLICHVPPSGPMWIWVDDSALTGHLDHGDHEWFEGAECGGQPYPADDDCGDGSEANDDDDCDDDLYFMHLPVVRIP